MFIRGCRRCMQIRAQSGPVSICVLLCELRNVARYYERDSLSYYSCSVSFRFFLLFFFFYFVRSRVNFAKSVDDNAERSKRWFCFLRLLFIFFYIIAHLDRSRIVPCLFYFNPSSVVRVFSNKFAIWNLT